MDNEEKKENKNDETIKEKNISSKKKGKGKWLVIIAIILVVIVAVIVIYNRNNDYYFEDDDFSSYGKNEISADLFNFKCSLSNEAGIEKIKANNVYGVGDHLLCNIEMSYKYEKQISSLSLYFVSHNIELVEVYSISDDWHIKESDSNLYKEDDTYVYMKSMGRSNSAKITDVKFHLHIKGNENVDDSFGVGFSNVTINLVNDNKYDYFKEKIIGFPVGESRYYKKGESIIFEKVQENGSFKEANSYKCKTSDWCTTSIAKESFIYQNDNKNTIMITDKENDKYIAIIFNVDKGIVGTYSDTESWLYSNKYEYQSGTYIYIKAKDSENFGIIDKEGNIIHDFNLGSTNAFYKSLLTTAYSIENDMIIDQKNNKYGVSKISSNDKIIDYKFDSIRFIVNGKSTEIKEGTSIRYVYEKTVDNKYFKAKLNGKWYLYSFDTKEKVTSEGYDNLFVANDKILVVEKDKYLYITDYQGNNLIEDKIEDLSEKYYEFVCCAANPGIEVETKDNIITITTYKNNNWEDYNQYEYNISDNTLTKKK